MQRNEVKILSFLESFGINTQKGSNPMGLELGNDLDIQRNQITSSPGKVKRILTVAGPTKKFFELVKESEWFYFK